MTKSSQPLGQGISNFLLSILLDLTLEFLDSAYISLVLDNRHSQFENVLYETRINIIESFENFNTQIIIVGNIRGAFSRLFKITLCMTYYIHYVKNEALPLADFQLYLKT